MVPTSKVSVGPPVERERVCRKMTKSRQLFLLLTLPVYKSYIYSSALSVVDYLVDVRAQLDW